MLLDKPNQTQQVKKCIKYSNNINLNNTFSSLSALLPCTLLSASSIFLWRFTAARVRGVQGTNLSSSGSDLESKSSRLNGRDKHHTPGQDTLITVPITIQFTEQEPTRRTWTSTAYSSASDYSRGREYTSTSSGLSPPSYQILANHLYTNKPLSQGGAVERLHLPQGMRASRTGNGSIRRNWNGFQQWGSCMPEDYCFPYILSLYLGISIILKLRLEYVVQHITKK